MRIIDGGDYLFAVGLDWEHSHMGVFSKGEVRKLAANHKATHFVEHRTPSGINGPEHAYGFGKVPALKGEKREILSLASLVASPRTDAFMFVAPLDGGEAVFIGVLSGQPTAGNDLVGSEAEVREAASMFRDANGVLQVYFARDLGRPDFLSEEFDLKEMELDVSSTNPKLHRVGGVSMFLVGAGALAVLGVGIIGLLAWKKAQDEAEMRARAPAISPQMAYAMSRDAAMAEHSPVPISAGFGPVVDLLLNLRTRSGGWEAKRTHCTWVKGSTPPAFECITKWSNRAGNFQTFEPQPGTAAVVYDDALVAVGTHHTVSTGSARQLGPDVIGALPRFASFKLETGSLLQDLGQLEFKVGTSAPALLGAAADPSVTDKVLRLGWTLEGPVDLAASYVPALPPNLTLEEAELSIPDARQAAGKPESVPRIKLTGGIYVRQ
jgi:hypothetical protein